MLTKIAKVVVSSIPEYEDPRDRLLVHYINSGEARDYGISPGKALRFVGAGAGMGAGIGAGMGAGIGAATSKSVGRGAGVGAAITAGGVALGSYFNRKRKKESRQVLAGSDNRRLLHSKLEELRNAGVSTTSPNQLNRYLQSKLPSKK
jgi:hypothetical protein